MHTHLSAAVFGFGVLGASHMICHMTAHARVPRSTMCRIEWMQKCVEIYVSIYRQNSIQWLQFSSAPVNVAQPHETTKDKSLHRQRERRCVSKGRVGRTKSLSRNAKQSSTTSLHMVHQATNLSITVRPPLQATRRQRPLAAYRDTVRKP